MIPLPRSVTRTPRPKGSAVAVLALSLGIANASHVTAADLDLRGGFLADPSPDVVITDKTILDERFLGLPAARRGDGRVVDIEILPRLDPIADLPTARQGSSILRIGEPSSSAPVADGRVERPAPRPGSVGTLPGGDTDGGLVVVRQDVRDLIEQVARFYGFETVLTRQVQGELVNERLPSDFSAFLDRLTNDRNLVFYFRDRELNASARSENVSRVIGLGPSSPAELRAAIEAAGVDADRFPLQFIEASNSVLVNGPPSFIGLVEVIAESLVRTDRSAADVTIIRGNQIDRSPIEPPRPTAPSGGALSNPFATPVVPGSAGGDAPAGDG